MKSNFPNALAHTLVHEGGYSNHPKDPGGATNKGVIQRVYNSYRRNKGQAPRSVKQLTDTELKDIYRSLYWDLVKGDQLPVGLDYCVFDFAVNSGPSRSVKFLQKAINRLTGRNLKVDGVMGPATIDAANSYDPRDLIAQMCDSRLTWLRTLKTFLTFGKGWSARVKAVHRDALAMVGDTISVEMKPPVPKELGGDAPKTTPGLDIVTGVLGVSGTGFLSTLNNPYALAFALAVLALGALWFYRKYA